jgi:hypothetical protein
MITLMRCILHLARSVHYTYIATVVAGEKNYVPERIRAAGFTDLR